MAILIDDPQATRMAEALAERLGVTPEEAVRRALSETLDSPGGLSEPGRPYVAQPPQRPKTEAEVAETLRRVRELQAKVASYPPTGHKADKAFFDWLNDE